MPLSRPSMLNSAESWLDDKTFLPRSLLWLRSLYRHPSEEWLHDVLSPRLRQHSTLYPLSLQALLCHYLPAYAFSLLDTSSLMSLESAKWLLFPTQRLTGANNHYCA